MKSAKRAFYEGLKKYFDFPMHKQEKELKNKFRQGLKLRFSLPKQHSDFNSADLHINLPN